jgi:hypothetical protein
MEFDEIFLALVCSVGVADEEGAVIPSNSVVY